MSRGGVSKEPWQEDPEFGLLLAACRSAFDGSAEPKVRELVQAGVDWARLDRLASFHRVQGLACRALQKAGAPTSEQLRRQAELIAARNLENIASCAELLDRFAATDLQLIILKGLPLGVLAYGNPWLKAAVDIDVMVDPGRLEESIAALKHLGFRRSDAKPEEIGALRAWHRFRKDSEWARPDSSTRIDLHTRLTDNPSLLPSIGSVSPRQLVEVAPGVRVPCLADEEMFAHLCVHGASSAWFRLKWITDLAALLRPRPGSEIARLYHRSQELGAGRAAAQALLLADALYDSLDECPDLRRSLAADGRARWLYRQALWQLAGKREPTEPTARPLGTLRIHLTQFALLPGFAFKASELVRQARAAIG